MANRWNRQTGGKSGTRKVDQKADQQNLEQNQFGLKEAYTILQRGMGSFKVNTCMLNLYLGKFY